MQSVYALIDPRDSQVRYIGIARDVFKRYAQHINYPHKNAENIEWINDLKASGTAPLLKVIETNISDKDIYEREKYWITHYIKSGAALTNIIVPKSVKKKDGNYLRIEEVAARIGICERSVYRLIKAGRLVGFKEGREWHFQQADIDAYLQVLKEKEERLKAEWEAYARERGWDIEQDQDIA